MSINPGRDVQRVGTAAFLGEDVGKIHDPVWAVIGNLGDSQCYLGVPQKVQAVQATLSRRIAEDALAIRLIPPAFTLGVSDGQLNGTPQMRFSLVGRELVHDVADVHLAANSVAGVVAVVACDKPPVGTVAAVLENNTPAVIVSDGPIRPGIDPETGGRIDLVSAFQMADQDAEIRARYALHACPGQGSCGGMFTYNTMQTFIAVLGLEPLHMVSPASDDPRRLTEFPDQTVDCLLAMTDEGHPAARHRDAGIAAQRPHRHHRHGRVHQRAAAQRRDRSCRRSRPLGRRAQPGRLQRAGPATAGAGQHAAVRRLLHGGRGRQGRAAGHRQRAPRGRIPRRRHDHLHGRDPGRAAAATRPAPARRGRDLPGREALQGHRRAPSAAGQPGARRGGDPQGRRRRRRREGRRLHRPRPRLQRRALPRSRPSTATRTASWTTTWW